MVVFGKAVTAGDYGYDNGCRQKAYDEFWEPPPYLHWIGLGLAFLLLPLQAGHQRKDERPYADPDVPSYDLHEREAANCGFLIAGHPAISRSCRKTCRISKLRCANPCPGNTWMKVNGSGSKRQQKYHHNGPHYHESDRHGHMLFLCPDGAAYGYCGRDPADCATHPEHCA